MESEPYIITLYKAILFLTNLFPNHLSVYLFIGMVQGLIFSKWQTDIFDWNPELEFNTIASKTSKGKIYYFSRDKREAYKGAPKALRLARGIKMFLGIMIGWIILWLLLENRLNYLTNTTIKLEDFTLFILAFVAISGRLPIIADSVQDWFKR